MTNEKNLKSGTILKKDLIEMLETDNRIVNDLIYDAIHEIMDKLDIIKYDLTADDVERIKNEIKREAESGELKDLLNSVFVTQELEDMANFYCEYSHAWDYAEQAYKELHGHIEDESLYDFLEYGIILATIDWLKDDAIEGLEEIRQEL